MKQKPVVKFKFFNNDPIMVGHRVVILSTNHPSPFVTNTREVLTSPVEATFVLNGKFGFSTRNTVYLEE